MNTQNPTHDFKGFGDWIEIFKAGTHTDSQGNTATYSQADLDQIVANHSEADAAPIVIGHPKTNDPAWGWAAELKRDGDSLFFKARDVEPTFEEAVAKGRYRKRSVRLAKTDTGFKLKHIGFLGAKPPAIDGLAAMYSEEDGEFHDFEEDLVTPTTLQRMMRRMRDFLIEKFSIEEADRVMPDYEIETLTTQIGLMRAEEINEPPTSYSQHDPKGDSNMGDFTQADVDAAVEKARTEERDKLSSDFSAEKDTLQKQLDTERRSNKARDFQSMVDAQIDAGKLTPAQAEGAVDFMLSLDAEQEFEFSSGEGDKSEKVKKSPAQWFQDFMQSLPKQVDLGESGAGGGIDEGGAADYSAPDGMTVDADRLDLDRKARDYMAKHEGVDYLAAVMAVEKQ